MESGAVRKHPVATVPAMHTHFFYVGNATRNETKNLRFCWGIRRFRRNERVLDRMRRMDRWIDIRTMWATGRAELPLRQARGLAARQSSDAPHTHFISLGNATRNENYFWGKMFGFIGVFEDSGAGECEREWQRW